MKNILSALTSIDVLTDKNKVPVKLLQNLFLVILIPLFCKCAENGVRSHQNKIMNMQNQALKLLMVFLIASAFPH